MIRFTVLLILCLGLTQARAAEPTLISDVEVFFPFGSEARGGGVAAMGKSTMELAQEKEKFTAIKLAGPNDPVQGAWWFPKHRPMTAEQALVGNDKAKFILRAKSAKPVKSHVTFTWRAEGEAGETTQSAAADFGPVKSTEVAIAIPRPAANAKITGLIIGFSKAGEYEIEKLALVREARVDLDAIDAGVLRLNPTQKITGKAAAGINEVTLRFKPDVKDFSEIEKTVAVKDGQFEFPASSKEIPAGTAYKVSAEPKGKPEDASPSRRLFVFPQLTGKKNPPITREGAFLLRNGERFGFLGVNYTRFNLGLSVEADYEVLAHDIVQMKSWGVRVVRVTTDIGMTQPAPGVFPGHPDYEKIIRAHKIDPRYWDQLDYFIQLAGEHDIYLVLDWHQMPSNPYRYFLGGKPSDREAGKPGTAIAYLAKSPYEVTEFSMEIPLHLKTLLDSTRWVAQHLKGNPNILGMEIPYNEPHTKYMAIEANWRRVVDQCAQAVAEGDPERLTFTLGPSYSHNNLLPSVTWLPPDRASGAAPHFYQANGPVPVRPDAKNFRSPWLARDNEATFGWSFPGVMMPMSAANYPIYNGESGAHGHDQVLPNNPESSRILVEAQLFQEYYTGMAGRLEWTLWGYEHDFMPYVETYKTLFRRFAPVYNAGPVDRMVAQVAFIQHTEAAQSKNGHNFSCIPFAKAALDIHLNPVHYLTDDQFRYFASAELSVGLEQVVEASENLKYKAYIVDKRKLDERVVAALKSIGVPVLWLDSADDLTGEKLAEFVKSAGVPVDTRTPRDIQWAEGPGHLVVYRRLRADSDRSAIYPNLRRAGNFELVDESGKSVFTGNAKTLEEKGINIDLGQWRSLIFEIRTVN